jgi:hypothetical protein
VIDSSIAEKWNEVEIWRAIKAQQTPPDAVLGDKRAWLLWRNQKRLTEFRSVPMDEYTLPSKSVCPKHEQPWGCDDRP